MRMTVLWIGMSLWGVGCVVSEAPVTSETEQNGMNMQGMNMQGMNMQGMNMQGMNMQGFELGGATMAGVGLDNVRVEKGEVVAESAGQTLRGASLVGAHFFAQVASSDAVPIVAEVEYRITAIASEASQYDPTHTGSTFLYSLEQYDSASNAWVQACGADLDGRQVAIPIAAVFDSHGNRVESQTMFTFGCTTGVIAKCYRWGYRPWLTGYSTPMTDIHWTCTRLARADYCGDGTSHTRNGTWVNEWDRLSPAPIQSHGGLLPPLGMLFEAGWNTHGAVCLSRARWILDDTVGNLCPDKLVPPGLLGATVCDTVAGVLGYDPNAKLFNESYLNLF